MFLQEEYDRAKQQVTRFLRADIHQTLLHHDGAAGPGVGGLSVSGPGFLASPTISSPTYSSMPNGTNPADRLNASPARPRLPNAPMTSADLLALYKQTQMNSPGKIGDSPLLSPGAKGTPSYDAALKLAQARGLDLKYTTTSPGFNLFERVDATGLYNNTPSSATPSNYSTQRPLQGSGLVAAMARLPDDNRVDVDARASPNVCDHSCRSWSALTQIL